jgi:hypothetical protein
MNDDGGGPFRANVFGLPMAVAEDLACDLICRRRRDLDKLRFGWRQIVRARQIVTEKSLQMAVAEKAPWLKVCSG